jgi:hypothetical protein
MIGRAIRVAAVVAALLPASARAQMPTLAFASEARVAIGSSGLEPSLVLGGRLAGRVQIGLGFQLTRTSVPMGLVGPVVNQTVFSFVPQLEADLLKSSDNHAAWYIRLALPLGQENNPDPVPNLFVLGYEIGLGGRYCPHPNFAVALEGGISGAFYDPAGTRGRGVTGFYGALAGTFYWGH